MTDNDKEAFTDEGLLREVDRSREPKREPGPINLQRYEGVPAYGGIATFMGVPVCLTQEDLRAGKVDVAIMGAPVDMGSGARGASYGPRYLRSDDRSVERIPSIILNPATRIHPFNVLKVVDYGDAARDAWNADTPPDRGRTYSCPQLCADWIAFGGRT